jgi:xanthosine phosphorylase
MTESLPEQAATVVSSLASIKPKIGLILGSGLGDVAKLIQNSTRIPYQHLPGFPLSQVSGHANQLLIGNLANQPVACLQGRIHYYETGNFTYHKNLIRTLKCLGCETLVITCAAGSLDPRIPSGSMMLVNDHINLQGSNPLMGPNDEDFGPRFVDMEDAYDPKLSKLFLQTADELNIALPTGTYIAVSGPNFETPAEIAAFRILGANAVGMSTVAEVLIARHCGLRVVVIAGITNLAAGISREKLSHETTLQGAAQIVEQLSKLLFNVFAKM